MIIFKQYRIDCVTLYVIMALTSYNTLSSTNLKRESTAISFEVSQAKRFAFDTVNPIENLPDKVFASKKDTKNPFYDHIVKEYVDIAMMSEVTSQRTITHQGIDTNDKEDKNKDRIISELVAEMVWEEQYFIPSNLQLHSGIPDHLKNREVDLLNSQTEAMDRNLLVVPNFKENTTQQQQDDVYSYSNSMFLINFLKFPSPIFTADSIRVRFGSGFLNFLSTDQLIRVLATLLSSDLELTSVERTELVETIFGHIDFSLEMNFNNDQIVSIVTALLRSDVPHCFEQVFLTWKMWKVFTIEEQENMLEGVINDINEIDKMRIKYKQETLVMLYLFVLNKDAVNSNICKVFERHIIKIYEKTYVFDNNEILSYLMYIEKNLSISDTLDTSLLKLPYMLKKINSTDLIYFKKAIRQNMRVMRGYIYSTYHGKRYKIHILYALTKFTPENAKDNNEGGVNIFDNMYFEPEYIKYVFNKWSRMLIKDSSLVKEWDTNEFKCAYGAMRQIIQSDGYDFVAFLRLFYTMNTSNFKDRMFALILFSLAKEDILRNVSKTPMWAERIKDKNTCLQKFKYIEIIFMYNVDLSLILLESYLPNIYLKRIADAVNNLINMTEGMHRERYLYQQLLFHPKFNFFNNSMMVLYIMGLDNIGQLNNKEKRLQIARDLIFNKFYYESIIKLRSELMKIKGNISEFGTSLIEEYKRYKNETDIENERIALKNC